MTSLRGAPTLHFHCEELLRHDEAISELRKPEIASLPAATRPVARHDNKGEKHPTTTKRLRGNDDREKNN